MVQEAHRAFVTGASGFVGRTLLEYLSAQHVSVTALSRGTDSDIAILKACPLATICRGDTCSVLAMEDGMRGCDWVFNCAASNQPHTAWGEHVEGACVVGGAAMQPHLNWIKTMRPMLASLTLTDIVEDAKDVATAASKAGVKRLIHVSVLCCLHQGGSFLGVPCRVRNVSGNVSWLSAALLHATEQASKAGASCLLRLQVSSDAVFVKGYDLHDLDVDEASVRDPPVWAKYSLSQSMVGHAFRQEYDRSVEQVVQVPPTPRCQDMSM
jgi:hypothetical protein